MRIRKSLDINIVLRESEERKHSKIIPLRGAAPQIWSKLRNGAVRFLIPDAGECTRLRPFVFLEALVGVFFYVA